MGIDFLWEFLKFCFFNGLIRFQDVELIQVIFKDGGIDLIMFLVRFVVLGRMEYFIMK